MLKPDPPSISTSVTNALPKVQKTFSNKTLVDKFNQTVIKNDNWGNSNGAPIIS
jgi:hypothetical protein